MSKNNHFFEDYATIFSKDSIWLFLTTSESAKSIYFYAQECGHFKTSKGYYTERKNLNSFLILYTISGKGKLEYENHLYEINADTAFFINCNNRHRYYCISEHEPWEFLWVHFNGMQALGYYQEYTKDGFQLLNTSDISPLPQMLEDLISIYQKTDITTEVLASQQLTQILTQFLLSTCTNPSAPFSIPGYIKYVKEYIDHHFREHLTLDLLAMQVHISKYYLSHEFKKYMGMTLNEYIIKTRLSYAKELLCYSSLSIEEIAFKAGINQTSYFIRIFKSREQMTPGAFRNLWKI